MAHFYVNQYQDLRGRKVYDVPALSRAEAVENIRTRQQIADRLGHHFPVLIVDYQTTILFQPNEGLVLNLEQEI